MTTAQHIRPAGAARLTSDAQTMKAIVQDQYGEADVVLRLEPIDKPDIAGNRSLSALRRALTSRGTLVITGGETDGRWLGGNDRQLRAVALSPFVGQTLKTFICSENNEDLFVLKDLIETGQITPTIDRTYPLRQVPDAIRHMQEGHARGKVVITV